MTTEDDFQRGLDANPDDYSTRLVFADWLQEQGDPRAEGYRALGLCRRSPIPYAPLTAWWLVGIGEARHDDLPEDWFRAITPDAEEACSVHKTRRAAEDAAALAFAKLPPERRAELLAGRSGGN